MTAEFTVKMWGLLSPFAVQNTAESKVKDEDVPGCLVYRHWEVVDIDRQLADCVTVDSAWNGGLVDNGFAFAEKNAMCTEDSYGTCSDSSLVKEVSPGSGRDSQQRLSSSR